MGLSASMEVGHILIAIITLLFVSGFSCIVIDMMINPDQSTITYNPAPNNRPMLKSIAQEIEAEASVLLDDDLLLELDPVHSEDVI